MGWGSFKKSVKNVVRKLPAVQLVKGVKNAFKSDDEQSTGQRSEAAKRLVEKSNQAGGGQIKFNTEEYVE